MTKWLIDYGLVSTHDHELIEQFKLEVYPLYQQLADRATLETVEKHISYVAKQRYKHPVGYFKKRSEEHTSELQSRFDLVCRLLLEKKRIKTNIKILVTQYTI